jgi:hypothetical protein
MSTATRHFKNLYKFQVGYDDAGSAMEIILSYYRRMESRQQQLET